MNEITEPLISIHDTLAFGPKDYSINKDDAWIYGIVCGWDKLSMAEMQRRHGWTDNTVKRLVDLHNKFNFMAAMSVRDDIGKTDGIEVAFGTADKRPEPEESGF